MLRKPRRSYHSVCRRFSSARQRAADKTYTKEDAVFDPTLVDEVPFKEKPKVEAPEEIAAMGIPVRNIPKGGCQYPVRSIEA